jgi:MoaA/NifB/PqqE/SkfB family radical SAM enzyme
MFAFWRGTIHDFFSPAFQWLQVEVSSLCNGACIYCPRTIFRKDWQGQNMTLETFRKLEPALKRTKLVYLQGWGEPFLNPDFFEMVRIAKNAGCQTGTTTNGILIGQDMIEKIFDSELDIIAFSLAGTGETNDKIRRGTSFNGILKSIEIINDIKQKRGLSKPKIHIAYLLMRSDLDEVEKLPDCFKDRGIEQIVISTLDFVADRQLQAEVIFPEHIDEYDYLANILNGVVENGRKLNLEIHYYLGSSSRDYTYCTENTRYAAFISADGAVAPCVFLNIPVTELSYCRNINRKSSSRLIFGNINRESLASIWGKREYVEFRRSFDTANIYPACEGCPKLHMEVK